MNCQPNYKSIMSYALAYDDSGSNAAFSSGEFSSIPLNPSQVDETTGLGTSNWNDIKFLANSFFHYNVAPTGAVDWNRDGRIDSTPVRAAVTWGWGAGGCEQVAFAMDQDIWSGSGYTALSYLPWPSSDPRLYWFVRRISDGTLQYRYATSLPDNCSNPQSPSCKTNWSPAASSAAPVVPGALSGNGSPASGWYTNSVGKNQLVLVYKDTSDHLRYQVLTPYLHLGAGWIESWTTPAYVGSGTETIDGSPAVVSMDGNIHVYAIVNDVLNHWTLDGSGGWSGPVAQQWDDSTTIQAAYGVGLTRGYLQTASGHEEHVFAAIPLVSPQDQIELAWQSAPDVWTKLPSSRWTDGYGHLSKEKTREQPGLAYEPFDRTQNLYEGRFYLAWNPTDLNGDCHAAYLSQTEGNDLSASATSRRMMFVDHRTYYMNIWNCVNYNIALQYDMSFDESMRGAQAFGDGTNDVMRFSPAADGIFNAPAKDQDDYAVILGNLRCSLGQGSCL